MELQQLIKAVGPDRIQQPTPLLRQSDRFMQQGQLVIVARLLQTFSTLLQPLLAW